MITSETLLQTKLRQQFLPRKDQGSQSTLRVRYMDTMAVFRVCGAPSRVADALSRNHVSSNGATSAIDL